MSIKGIDVSEFQGTINWKKVKAAGYQFAMLRVGYGFGTVDKKFLYIDLTILFPMISRRHPLRTLLVKE